MLSIAGESSEGGTPVKCKQAAPVGWNPDYSGLQCMKTACTSSADFHPSDSPPHPPCMNSLGSKPERDEPLQEGGAFIYFSALLFHSSHSDILLAGNTVWNWVNKCSWAEKWKLSEITLSTYHHTFKAHSLPPTRNSGSCSLPLTELKFLSPFKNDSSQDSPGEDVL